jgi:hypothetical protein
MFHQLSDRGLGLFRIIERMKGARAELDAVQRFQRGAHPLILQQIEKGLAIRLVRRKQS